MSKKTLFAFSLLAALLALTVLSAQADDPVLYRGSTDIIVANTNLNATATVAYLPFAVYALNAQFTRITVLNLDAASADICIWSG